jgi:DNA polymerase-3 subunit delta'
MRNLSIVKKKFFDYVDHLIENNKISHAYIIELDNYEDNMTDVYDFIKMILFNKKHGELEQINENITNYIDNNMYPDIKIIEPDGNNIRKRQLIELQKEYSNKSLLDNKRIYLIKNSEKMNQASGNTILKFLEEPEENIIALLLTDNRYNVLETILSRCQILSLKETNLLDDEEEKFIEFLKHVVNPKEFFKRYNYFINNYIVDKNVAKEKLMQVESTIIQFLNNQYFGENYDNQISDILREIEEKN